MSEFLTPQRTPVGERTAQLETRHRPEHRTLGRNPSFPAMVIRMNFYNDEDGGPMLARVGTWYLQIPNRLIFEDGVI